MRTGTKGSVGGGAGGDITEVVAGTNLSGGGVSGSVTLSVENAISLADVTTTGKALRSVDAGIVASATQTQGQQPLTKDINEVATVATTGDAVTLPPAESGRELFVINNGSLAMSVFPASGDNIRGSGVDVAWSQAAQTAALYTAYDATNWDVAEQGDITGVTAGTNLDGGGNAGNVVIDVSDNVDLAGNMIARGAIAGSDAAFGGLAIQSTTDPSKGTISFDSDFLATTANGPALYNEDATATNVNILPRKASTTLGIGARSGTQMDLAQGNKSFLTIDGSSDRLAVNMDANDIDFAVYDDLGLGLFYSAATRRLRLGVSSAAASKFTIWGNADEKQLKIRAHTAQASTNHLLETAKSDDTLYFAVDGAGLALLYTVAGITASTTQTQGQQPLVAQINEVATVTNNLDVVTLPSSKAGLEITIINNSTTNYLQVYPASGDAINGQSVNTSTRIAPSHTMNFYAYDATNWVSSARIRSEERIYAATLFNSVGANKPDLETLPVGASGNIVEDTLAFGNLSVEQIPLNIHAPSNIDPNENVSVSIMWRPDPSWTTGAYAWKLEYLVKGEGDDMTTGTPTTISQTVTPSNATDAIETTFASTIDLGENQVIVARFYRDTADAGDTADDDGHVRFFEIEYTAVNE